MTCETGHHFRRMYARTGLAGVRHMQVLYMRKVLYIPKATSAPPRAGTTGNYDMIRDNYHYVFIIMMIILFFLPLPLTPSGLCGPQYGEKKWEHLPSLLCKRCTRKRYEGTTSNSHFLFLILLVVLSHCLFLPLHLNGFLLCMCSNCHLLGPRYGEWHSDRLCALGRAPRRGSNRKMGQTIQLIQVVQLGC